MANTNRAPKIISTNNPCKTKPLPNALLEQPTARKTPTRRPTTPNLNYYPTTTIPIHRHTNNNNSSCSETNSCCSTNSPVTQTINRNNYATTNHTQKLKTNYQNQNQNQKTNQNQNQKPNQNHIHQNQNQKLHQHPIHAKINPKQSPNTTYNRLSQSIPHPITATTANIYNAIDIKLQKQQQKLVHQTSPNPTLHSSLYDSQNVNNLPLLHPPQLSRSPSAPVQHASLANSPLIRTTHLRSNSNSNSNNNYLVEDSFDSARVNRKILDLEISNASLLAINGALERTKVNQQNEIRTIKKRLLQQQETMTNNQITLNGNRMLTGRKKERRPDSEGQPEEEYEQDDEEEEEGDGEEDLSLDRLIEEDRDFGNVIQSITELISNGTKAINFQPLPLLNPSTSSSPLLSSTTTTVGEDSTGESHGPVVSAGKSKVLNPVQAQRFLSNLDSCLSASDDRLLLQHHLPRNLDHSLLFSHP